MPTDWGVLSERIVRFFESQGNDFVMGVPHLRIMHPKQVWLNRGNHEDRQQNLRTTKIGNTSLKALFHGCLLATSSG